MGSVQGGYKPGFHTLCVSQSHMTSEECERTVTTAPFLDCSEVSRFLGPALSHVMLLHVLSAGGGLVAVKQLMGQHPLSGEEERLTSRYHACPYFFTLAIKIANSMGLTDLSSVRDIKTSGCLGGCYHHLDILPSNSKNSAQIC